jgi:hypothetical protein
MQDLKVWEPCQPPNSVLNIWYLKLHMTFSNDCNLCWRSVCHGYVLSVPLHYVVAIEPSKSRNQSINILNDVTVIHNRLESHSSALNFLEGDACRLMIHVCYSGREQASWELGFPGGHFSIWVHQNDCKTLLALLIQFRSPQYWRFSRRDRLANFMKTIISTAKMVFGS